MLGWLDGVARGSHGPVVADLVEDLRTALEAGNGLSLVALEEATVVGHVLFTRSLLDVFLEGPPAYYERFGFVGAGALGFRKPSLRIPDAGFQVKLLSSFEPWMTGTLVYSQAFWDHDCVGLR